MNDPVPGRHRTKIKKRTRLKVYERDGYKCVKCGGEYPVITGVSRVSRSVHGNHLTLNHKVPWSLGGGNALDNLETMCYDCNNGESMDIQTAKVEGGVYMLDVTSDLVAATARACARGDRQKSTVNELLTFKDVSIHRPWYYDRYNHWSLGLSQLRWSSWTGLRGRLVAAGFVVVVSDDAVRITHPALVGGN